MACCPVAPHQDAHRVGDYLQVGTTPFMMKNSEANRVSSLLLLLYVLMYLLGMLTSVQLAGVGVEQRELVALG